MQRIKTFFLTVPLIPQKHILQNLNSMSKDILRCGISKPIFIQSMDSVVTKKHFILVIFLFEFQITRSSQQLPLANFFFNSKIGIQIFITPVHVTAMFINMQCLWLTISFCRASWIWPQQIPIAFNLKTISNFSLYKSSFPTIL